MARHYDGPFGDVTAAGVTDSVTLMLDGAVSPSELLLVCATWEPLGLPETYVDATTGAVSQKHIEIDRILLPYAIEGTVPTYDDLPTDGNDHGDAWLTDDTGQVWVWLFGEWTEGDPDGADITDAGYLTVATQVGFAEYPRMHTSRGPTDPEAGYSGIPVYPSEPEFMPSGIAANMFGVWHPAAFDQLTFTFRSRMPVTRPQPVDWVTIRSWKIAAWGGRPVSRPGVVGVGRNEPGEGNYDAFAVLPAEPEELWYHACPQGGQYFMEDPFPLGSYWISDGGDTERHWTPGLMADHHIEYGIAGRFGQGEGTFAWDDWDDPTLIGTLDHTAGPALINIYAGINANFASYAALNAATGSYADVLEGAAPQAHFEFYVKTDEVGGPIDAQGTFGPQTHTQSLPPPPSGWPPDLSAIYPDGYWLTGSWTFRGPGGVPADPTGSPRLGAMLRGAGIAVATAPGGWLPQIYRRVGPAQ